GAAGAAIINKADGVFGSRAAGGRAEQGPYALGSADRRIRGFAQGHRERPVVVAAGRDHVVSQRYGDGPDIAASRTVRRRAVVKGQRAGAGDVILASDRSSSTSARRAIGGCVIHGDRRLA